MPHALALAAVLFIAGAGRASAAKLVFAAGPVQIESKGERRAAKPGEQVRAGDAVSTGGGATAIVEFDDGSRVKLRGDSRFVLEAADEQQTTLYLALGGLFSKVAKLGGQRRFKVRTHAAVLAVRGTEFFTAYGRRTRRGHDMWACVNEGSIELSSLKEPGAVLVKAGEGVLVKDGSRLTKPQAFDWTKDLNWSMDAAKGPVEDTTDLGGAYADLLDQDYR